MPAYASLTSQTSSNSPTARRTGKPSAQDANSSNPTAVPAPRSVHRMIKAPENVNLAGSSCSLSSTPGAGGGSLLPHNFGSSPNSTHTSAGVGQSVGSSLCTPSHTPPMSPFSAGMQPSPFSTPVAQFTGLNTPIRAAADAASSISMAAPVGSSHSTPDFKAQQQFMGWGVSAQDIRHTGAQASSAPFLGMCNSSGTGALQQQQYACSSSMLAPTGQYACSSSMLAPASQHACSSPLQLPAQQQAVSVEQAFLPGLPAAPYVAPSATDMHFAALSASEPLNPALLQLLQLQGTNASSLDPAASLPVHLEGMLAAQPATYGYDVGMFGGVSGDANNAAGATGAALALGSRQAPFLPAHQDFLQLRLPAASAGPAMLPAAPAVLHALQPPSNDGDNDADLDGLSAVLDAQLQFLLARRDELIARCYMSAALSSMLV